MKGSISRDNAAVQLSGDTRASLLGRAVASTYITADP